MFDTQSDTIPQPYRTVHPVQAFLISLYGPADSLDHPLTGTKYDPYYKQLRHSAALERRRARAAQRKQRKFAGSGQALGAPLTAS